MMTSQTFLHSIECVVFILNKKNIVFKFNKPLMYKVTYISVHLGNLTT